MAKKHSQAIAAMKFGPAWHYTFNAFVDKEYDLLMLIQRHHVSISIVNFK